MNTVMVNFLKDDMMMDNSKFAIKFLDSSMNMKTT